MSTFTITLPSGTQWTPHFVADIDHDKCIGCGRCVKVCSREVLELRGVDEDGELLETDDDDFDEDEYDRRVRIIAHPEDCIGCRACALACTKKCYTLAPSAAG